MGRITVLSSFFFKCRGTCSKRVAAFWCFCIMPKYVCFDLIKQQLKVQARPSSTPFECSCDDVLLTTPNQHHTQSELVEGGGFFQTVETERMDLRCSSRRHDS